jgi:aminoglycoside phosphotransferase family enzyme
MGKQPSGSHGPDPEEGGVTLAEKVAFLRKPDAYPEHTRQVEAIETHLSWVFLTDRHAYKLKKPARLPHLDYSTLEARRTNSLTETRLNRRLAPDVYLGVVGLMARLDGTLYLGRPVDGAEDAVDWLVWMARLPIDRRLDQMIQSNAVTRAEIVRLGTVLCDFYRRDPTDPIAPSDYQHRFGEDARANLDIIIPRVNLYLAEMARRAADEQAAFLENHGALLRERAAQGRVVEAHGDLRPEHIFLDGTPRIIDCLEFDRDLRLLDPVDELAFLALECERLGAPWIGEEVLETYRAQSGDAPDPRLQAFYRSFRASVRARLAARRLDSAPVERHGDWLARVETYLRLAVTDWP